MEKNDLLYEYFKMIINMKDEERKAPLYWQSDTLTGPTQHVYQHIKNGHHIPNKAVEK